MTVPDALSRKDNCSGKRCCCATFNQLEFEPPLVLEFPVYVDTGVQTSTADSETCYVETSANCNKIEDLILCLDEPDSESKGCQTSILKLDPDIELDRVISIVPFFTKDEVKSAQNDDPDIKPVIDLLPENKTRPNWNKICHLSEESKILIQQWSELELKEGILYKKYHLPNDTFLLQMIVPYKFQKQILESCHDHVLSGHAGLTRTLRQVQVRFWFPKMREIIGLYVSSCDVCNRRTGGSLRIKPHGLQCNIF